MRQIRNFTGVFFIAIHNIYIYIYIMWICQKKSSFEIENIAIKQFGFSSILHTCFPSNALLNFSVSLIPIPPFFGILILFHANQCIPFVSSPFPHQNFARMLLMSVTYILRQFENIHRIHRHSSSNRLY